MNFEPSSLAWWGLAAIDVIGLFPGIGVLKYADEVFASLKGPVKALGKNMDNLFSGLAKSGDPILRILKGKTEELFS